MNAIRAIWRKIFGWPRPTAEEVERRFSSALTLPRLIEWLETRDPEETYSYIDVRDCLIARYLVEGCGFERDKISVGPFSVTYGSLGVRYHISRDGHGRSGRSGRPELSPVDGRRAQEREGLPVRVTSLRCDRCGAEFKDSPEAGVTSASIRTKAHWSAESELLCHESQDFCRACWNGLHALIAGYLKNREGP